MNARKSGVTEMLLTGNHRKESRAKPIKGRCRDYPKGVGKILSLVEALRNYFANQIVEDIVQGLE